MVGVGLGWSLFIIFLMLFYVIYYKKTEIGNVLYFMCESNKAL